MELFEIGNIAKLFSFKGEVILYQTYEDQLDWDSIDCIFLEMNNTKVPFFIEKIIPNKKNQIRVKFEDCDSENDAKDLLKAKAFVKEEHKPSRDDQRVYKDEIIGLILLDQEENEVGEIISFIENPLNPLVEVKLDANTAYIPFNEHTIINVDKDSSRVVVDIAEGLLDIYR